MYREREKERENSCHHSHVGQDGDDMYREREKERENSCHHSHVGQDGDEPIPEEVKYLPGVEDGGAGSVVTATNGVVWTDGGGRTENKTRPRWWWSSGEQRFLCLEW